MGNQRRFRCCKFFRRLIATSQPEEVEKIIERYEKEIENLEKNYMDVVLNSGGAINWQDVMTMPVPAITLFIKQINDQREREKQAMAKSRI